jgi:alpha-L-fucosidase
MLKGLMNTIKDIKALGTSQHLKPKIVGKISWSPVPGLIFINVPTQNEDPYMTVLKLKLDKPLQFCRGQGVLN